MQLPDELNSKRQDPDDDNKTKMYQSSEFQPQELWIVPRSKLWLEERFAGPKEKMFRKRTGKKIANDRKVIQELYRLSVVFQFVIDGWTGAES